MAISRTYFHNILFELRFLIQLLVFQFLSEFLLFHQ